MMRLEHAVRNSLSFPFQVNPNYYLAGDSSCSEDDDDDEYDASGLKPFKNAKVCYLYEILM